MNRVSRTQLALLNGVLEAAQRLNTAPRVPMAIVLTLSEYYFSAAPINVLRLLRHMGFVDFDDVQVQSFLRVRRLPHEEEILHAGEEPDALPRRDSIEQLVNAFRLRGCTDEKDLGRPEPEDSEKDDECPPSKPTKAALRTLEFLASHLLMETLVGGPLPVPLASLLTKRHWSDYNHPDHCRQTVRGKGLVRFDAAAGWSLTPTGRLQAKRATAPLSKTQALAMISQSGLHPRMSA